MGSRAEAGPDSRRLPRKRRAEVLDAAIHVLSEKGYLATTMEDVADRVGVLKGSLYYYVSSKEDLLERIFDDINGEARAVVAEARASGGGPLEQLHRYVVRYLTWYLTNFERVSIYFSEWRNLGGDRRERVLAQRAEFEGFVRELIEAARAEGRVDASVDAKQAAFFILSAINSMYAWYRKDGADTPEAIAASYADMAVGLLAGTRRPCVG